MPESHNKDANSSFVASTTLGGQLLGIYSHSKEEVTGTPWDFAKCAPTITDTSGPPTLLEKPTVDDNLEINKRGGRKETKRFNRLRRIAIGNIAVCALGLVLSGGAANAETERENHHSEVSYEGHSQGEDMLVHESSVRAADNKPESLFPPSNIPCIEGDEDRTIKIFYASTEENALPTEKEDKIRHVLDQTQGRMLALSGGERAYRFHCDIMSISPPDYKFETIALTIAELDQDLRGHIKLVFAEGNNGSVAGLGTNPPYEQATDPDYPIGTVLYSRAWNDKYVVHELTHNQGAIDSTSHNPYKCEKFIVNEAGERVVVDDVAHSALPADALSCHGMGIEPIGQEFAHPEETMDAAGDIYWSLDPQEDEDPSFYDSEYNIANSPYFDVLEPPATTELDPLEFSDMDATHTHSVATGRLSARGVISGFPDGTFRPNDPVSRAQLAVISARAQPEVDINGPLSRVNELVEGYVPYEDIKPGHPFLTEILWLTIARPLFEGQGDRLFEPNGTATRRQVAKVLCDFAGIYYPDFVAANHTGVWPTTFTDVDHANPQESGIGCATELGIMQGYQDDRFKPNRPVTRGQIATAFDRLQGAVE